MTGTRADADVFILDALKANAASAAELLRSRGWSPSKHTADDSELTLAGALHRGSAWGIEVYLNREILRDNDTGDAWQKEPGRTAEEVVTMLDTFTPTVSDVVRVLGTEWKTMMFVMGASSLIPPEITAEMDSLRDLAGTWPNACDQARDTAEQLGIRSTIADAFFTADTNAWCAARGAAWSAALASTIGHLDSDFTYESHCVLMEPFRRRAVPTLNSILSAPDNSNLSALAFGLFREQAYQLGIDGWTNQ